MWRRIRLAIATLGMSLTGLSRHRLRAFLSTLGIAIGVATLMAIYSLTQGLTRSFTEQISALGANTLYVSRQPWTGHGDWWKYRNRPRITLAEATALRQRSTILTAVAPMAFAQAEVKYRGESMTEVAIRGTTSDFERTSNIKVADGRFMSPVDDDLDTAVTVIGSDVKAKLFRGADPIGAKVVIGDRQYTVIGVLVQQGQALGNSQDNVAIIPIRSHLRSFGERRGLMIAVAADPNKLDDAQDQVIEVLRNVRGLSADQETNFAINRQSEIVKMFDDNTRALFGVALAIGVITLLVGGIGVMNIMLVAVTERTREIGVRRALGARRRTVLAQFLFEAAFVTMLGGAIGTLVGMGGAWMIGQITPLAAATSPQDGIKGVIVSGLVGLIFGVWPAWRASQLDPIESLRYE
jgi:putative ABC transport system permease protein